MGAKIAETSIKEKLRLSRTVGSYLPDSTNYTPQEFIAAAQKTLQDNPDEWIVLFMLGDNYQQAGHYAKALEVCKRCLELRPQDIRSAYALATVYNLLTRAAWTSEEATKANKALESAFGVHDAIKPELARQELKKVGISTETAAAQAIRWFEHALSLDPDKDSREQIRWDLETLYKRFPDLGGTLPTANGKTRSPSTVKRTLGCVGTSAKIILFLCALSFLLSLGRQVGPRIAFSMLDYLSTPNDYIPRALTVKADEWKVNFVRSMVDENNLETRQTMDELLSIRSSMMESFEAFGQSNIDLSNDPQLFYDSQWQEETKESIDAAREDIDELLNYELEDTFEPENYQEARQLYSRLKAEFASCKNAIEEEDIDKYVNCLERIDRLVQESERPLDSAN